MPFQGEWQTYCNILYAIFTHDFMETPPAFEGLTVSAIRAPMYEGKSGSFWHLISQGDVEEERLPDLRRCERIRWPRAIIDHADDVKVWRNTRKNKIHVCLWLKEENYLVVLGQRNGYFILRTAYLIENEHQQRKLQKEYEAYIASVATP